MALALSLLLWLAPPSPWTPIPPEVLAPQERAEGPVRGSEINPELWTLQYKEPPRFVPWKAPCHLEFESGWSFRWRRFYVPWGTEQWR